MVESTKANLEQGLTTELSTLKEEMKGLLNLKSRLEGSKQELGAQLEEVNKKFQDISKELLNAKTANEAYQAQIGGLQSQMNDNMQNMESESFQRYNELLSKFKFLLNAQFYGRTFYDIIFYCIDACIERSESIVRKNIEDLEHPLLTGGSGALDTFVMSCHETEKLIADLEGATGQGYGTFGGLKSILQQVPTFTNHICNLLIHGGATSQTSADIQKGDGMFLKRLQMQILAKTKVSVYNSMVVCFVCTEMLSDCRNLGGTVLTLLSSIKNRLVDNAVSCR